MNALLTSFSTTGSPACGPASGLNSNESAPRRKSPSGAALSCRTWTIGPRARATPGAGRRPAPRRRDCSVRATTGRPRRAGRRSRAASAAARRPSYGPRYGTLRNEPQVTNCYLRGPGSGRATQPLHLGLGLAVDAQQAIGIVGTQGRRRRGPPAQQPRETRSHASASRSTSAKTASTASCSGPGPTVGAAARARSSSFRSRRRSGEAEIGEARLARAEQGAAAAQLEVDLGELEAVGRVDERLAAARAPTRSAPRCARETSRQYDCSAPRPTRPRSWWSCASPKRSASWTIITVAFGTSTPTSITVVATRTSSSRALKRRHQLPPLGRLQPPVQAADAEARAARRGAAARPRLGGARERRLRLLDQRADDVGLAALAQQARAAACTPRRLRSSVDPARDHRLAAGGRLRDLARRRGRRRRSARACAGSASRSCAGRAARVPARAPCAARRRSGAARR